MDEVEREMHEAFEVKPITMPREDWEIVVNPFDRDELQVRADTLAARLAPMRAVLYQRAPAPFTSRDMDLRRRILKLYPRDRSTPFPIFLQKEPKFEVVGEES